MIPYTVERRPDTGVNNVTLGIWLLLASEAMLFGALFSAYALLRTAAPAWPQGRTVLSLPIGLATTVVLIAMVAVMWRLRSRAGAHVRSGLAVAALLALASLVLTGIEYRNAIGRGFVPSVSTFAGMYYTLTGVHALHVIGGFAATLWAIAGATRAERALTAGRVHALSLYSAFVSAMWTVVLVLMYLA